MLAAASQTPSSVHTAMTHTWLNIKTTFQHSVLNHGEIILWITSDYIEPALIQVSWLVSSVLGVWTVRDGL